MNWKFYIIGAIFLFGAKAAKSQLDRYIYGINYSRNEIDAGKLADMVTMASSGKSVFFLSDDRHDYLSISKARTALLLELGKRNKIDLLFEEFPMMEYIPFYDYLTGRLNADSIKRTWNLYGNLHLEDDFEDYKALMQTARFGKLLSAGLLQKLVPIDIGHHTINLPVRYVAELTKSKNYYDDELINLFCDSIATYYSLEFHSVLETRNEEESIFEQKRKNLRDFIATLQKYPHYSKIAKIWESAFAAYYKSRNSLKFVSFGSNARPRKASRAINSYRDSVIFSNFQFYYPDSSVRKHIFVSFSTYHLLDTRNNDWFTEQMEPQIHTLGKYLHNKYGDSIFHVAFICNSGTVKDKANDNKNYRKSLEYKLSQKFAAAYVDLKSYRENELNRKPFFLRPTFELFLQRNWEEIIDGLVFINNCECEQ